MGRTSLAFAFALGLGGSARAAHAETAPPRVLLDVTRAEGTDSCIERAALEQAVEKRLERPVFASANVDLRLAVAFERRGRAWLADVRLLDRTGSEIGRRELKTPARHCSVLDDSLALVVALLVDSPEAREHAAPPPAPTATETPSPSPSPPPPPPATTLTVPPDVLAPREPYRVTLGAAAALVVGPLPGAAFGPELFVAVRPPHFVELRLRPSYFPPREATGPTPDRGGRLSLVQVALDVCPIEKESAALRFSGCLGQSVGWVSAEGFGYSENQAPSSLVYSLGLGVGAVWFFAPPVGLSLGATAAVPFARDTYVARLASGRDVEVFSSGVVSAGLAAGLVVDL